MANPFTFGGADLYRLIPHPHVERRVLPAASVVSERVPGLAGEAFVAAELQPLQVTVTGGLASWTYDETAELRRAVAPSLSPFSGTNCLERRLVLPDEPGLFYLAVCTDTSIERPYGHGRAVLTFTCSDPVAYGELVTASLSAGTTLLNVSGTFATFPERIYAASGGGGFTVSNAATGRKTVASGGSGAVEILPRSMRCKVGGAEAGITLDSDYWELVPGSNPISASSACTITYYERWL